MTILTTAGATYLKENGFGGPFYVGLIEGSAATAGVSDTLTNHLWTESPITRILFADAEIILSQPLALGGLFLATTLDNTGILICVKKLTKQRVDGTIKIVPSLNLTGD